eukprot:10586043-Heterocapsa_arctica.AAC.1
MESCRAASTPAEPNDKPNDNSSLLGEANHATYRRVIGKTMYGCSVRPDLSYVVKELARKLAAPT